MESKTISSADIAKCPTRNLSPSHWMPEHKTEECDPGKLAKLRQFERKQIEMKQVRKELLEQTMLDEREAYAQKLRNEGK